MKPLLIKSTHSTPKVILDSVNNEFEISGKSFPENIFVFYNQIIEWFELYAENPNPATSFAIKLTYYNSATFKMIFTILAILSKIRTKGNEVTIYWHYEKDDIEQKEEGEYLSIKFDIPFEYECY